MPTCPVCAPVRRTSGPRGVLCDAHELSSFTPPCLLDAVLCDLAAQGHNLARRINGLRAGFRAFEGAVAAPDAVFAISQRQQVSHFSRVTGFLARTINCSQASRSHELVVNSHRRASAHAEATLDAVLEAIEPGKVVWYFDLF